MFSDSRAKSEILKLLETTVVFEPSSLLYLQAHISTANSISPLLTCTAISIVVLHS